MHAKKGCCIELLLISPRFLCQMPSNLEMALEQTSSTGSLLYLNTYLAESRLFNFIQ